MIFNRKQNNNGPKMSKPFRSIVVTVRASYCAYDLVWHNQSTFEYPTVAEARCVVHYNKIQPLANIVDDSEPILGRVIIHYGFGKNKTKDTCEHIGIHKGFSSISAWIRDNDNYLWMQKIQELVKKDIENEYEIFNMIK